MEFTLKIISTLTALHFLVTAAGAVNLIALDTETNSLNSHRASLVGISLALNEGTGYYIPVGHDVGKNINLELALEAVSTICKGKKLIGHNLKYDLTVLRNHGCDLDVDLLDTVVASYLLTPDGRQNSLNACAEKYLGHKMIPISKLIGKGRTAVTINTCSIKDTAEYAAEDAVATFRLWKVLEPKLEERKLLPLFTRLEMPLIRVLIEMESNGIRFDKRRAAELKVIAESELSNVVASIRKIVPIGKNFNLASPSQVSDLLISLGVKLTKSNKTGFVVDAKTLGEHVNDHPLINQILRYREIKKLLSTYLHKLPTHADVGTGIIHPQFNQCIAATGRLSCSNPNLQGIPKHTPGIGSVRECFTASNKSSRLVCYDYSQMELRVFAIRSKDEVFLKAFSDGIDIHLATAAKIYKKKIEDVLDHERSVAKQINFAILYGGGAKLVSQKTSMSVLDASEFLRKYNQSFPAIRAFQHKLLSFTRKYGYAYTIYGRKRWLTDINSADFAERAKAERAAINFPIQGSAADIMKIAMIKVYHKLKDFPEAKMLLQIHDELVIEVPEKIIAEITKLVRNEMENAIPEKFKNLITLPVDVEINSTWAKTKQK